MWKFIKKCFKPAEAELSLGHIESKSASRDVSEHSVVHDKKMQQFDEIGYYENWLNAQGSTDFEKVVSKLKSYNGHIRQKTLEEIKENDSAELFSYVLERLSDYVDINRKLATAHMIRWSQNANFSQLCIDHFLEIAALKYRDRTEQNILNLLLSEVGHQQIYLSETLISQQGKLPRVILNFMIEYQWMDKNKLFKLCQVAKDQKIRVYWLENMIQNETDDGLYRALKQSTVKDVQYRLFDILYRKNILSTEDLVHFWHNRFLNIMDYAYFALRQKKFDFEHYFSQNSIEYLTHSEVKIRAQQWLFVKGDVSEFFKILAQLDSKELACSFVLKALKQQYIDLDTYFEFLTQSKQTVKFGHFSKLKKYAQRYLSLNEMIQFLRLLDEPITLTQRLHMVDGYNSWEQLYWFVINHQYVKKDVDKTVFYNHIVAPIDHLSYEIYGAQWNVHQKEQMQTLLPAFIQNYPKIFDHQNIKNVLKPYLMNSSS